MDMNKELIDKAIGRFTQETKELYGDKLRRVILFGSCARSDFKEDSDIDVMVLLDVVQDMIGVERDKIKSVVHKLDAEFDYEILWAPVVQSEETFNKFLPVMPFYQNVMREGIRYA